MSARKAAHDRRMKLLGRARRGGRILINAEGGVGLDNPDLKHLVREGYLTVTRDPGVPKWSKRFNQMAGRSFHGTDMIRRSFAALTMKGRAALGLNQPDPLVGA